MLAVPVLIAATPLVTLKASQPTTVVVEALPSAAAAMSVPDPVAPAVVQFNTVVALAVIVELPGDREAGMSVGTQHALRHVACPASRSAMQRAR